MKNKIKIFAIATFFALPFFFQVMPARAAVLQFDAADYETQAWGPFGLGLAHSPGNPFWSIFQFTNVKFTVDTTPGGTGQGFLEGTIFHSHYVNRNTNVSTPTANSDIWNMRIDIDDVRMINHVDILSQPVPFDAMFQELIAGGVLVWDTALLNLSTSVLFPEYTGLTTLLGKANANGDVSNLRYNKWGAGASIFPSYWGSSIWWKFPNGVHAGDAHFTIGNPQTLTTTVIPEPGTFILLGLSLAGLGLFKRLKFKGFKE